jgi:hypothetical protein
VVELVFTVLQVIAEALAAAPQVGQALQEVVAPGQLGKVPQVDQR